MADESAQSYAPDVVTTYVWDAIKEIPGVADLHRSPLQALGEKVHLERLRPVRLEEHEGRHVLEVHLVVRPDAAIPALAEQVRMAASHLPEDHDGDRAGRGVGLRRRPRPRTRRRPVNGPVGDRP